MLRPADPLPLARPFAPIAIVGQACLLPGAASPEALWRAVVAGEDLLGRAPAGRWGLPRAQVLSTKPSPDHTWSDRGGYVTDFAFEAHGYALPAETFDGLDPLFHWVLQVSRQALEDAGTPGGPRTGLVLGNLSFPTTGMARMAEWEWLRAAGLPEVELRRAGLTPVDRRNRFMSGLPARLAAQALGLGQGGTAIDAACASGLYAIKLAAERLQDHEADVMIAAAVNRADDLFIHMGFAALQALSRSGRSRPFHKEADGLVPAEGCAALVLKREADALRDGDRIHAVIRGVGLSNDGRGGGMLSPSEEGQRRALQAAYAAAGLSPADIGLVECHATGTPVGDGTELRSMGSLYAGLHDVPIGSLKGNLGHLVTVAGIAAVIKVTEALRAGIRPPTLHAEAPNPALADGPFRLLHAAEAWDGPRRAAISAFGFGGNNAHLLLEAPGLSGDRSEGPTPEHAGRGGEGRGGAARAEACVVGLGAAGSFGADRAALTERLFAASPGPLPGLRTVALPLHDTRFPPRDLELALAQHTLVLAAGAEALAEVGRLPRERTGVYVGMGADPEVARWGARWRLPSLARAWGAEPEAIQQAQDSFAPPLPAAGVLGTMPNLVANRLSFQHDLAGPSFTVSAEEGSGLRALELALRALEAGEIDAALVAAVDLSDEPLHKLALEAMGLPSSEASDGAVALLLRRRDDPALAAPYAALRLAGPEEASPAGEVTLHTASRLGRPHAAAALFDVASAALCLHHRRLPGGAPWPLGLERRAGVDAPPTDARPGRVSLRALPGAVHGTRPAPILGRWAGDTVEQAIERLAGPPGGEGPARIVIAAADGPSFARRLAHARQALPLGRPGGPGVSVSASPLGGSLAFVYSGAAAAYPNMGRALLQDAPALAELSGASGEAPWAAVLAEGWGLDGLDTRQKLTGSLALSAMWTALAQRALGLEPDALLGYSSGETAALICARQPADWGPSLAAAERSHLFTEQLGGACRAVAEAWGLSSVDWAVWNLRAPVAEVEAALAPEGARARITVYNTDQDVVVAGEAAALRRVAARFDRSRCNNLDYPVVAHVGEAKGAEADWRRVHAWAAEAEPQAVGPRVYGGARPAPYDPHSLDAIEQLWAQATGPVDLRASMRQAWQDGVRVFVELGPGGSCSRWIDELLGDQPHLALSLDRKAHPVEALVEAAGALLAAGVEVSWERLLTLLSPRPAVLPGPTRAYPAHPTAPRYPAPTAAEPAERPLPAWAPPPTGAAAMPPAPRLPPLLEGVDLAEPEAAPAAQAPTFAEPEAAPVAPLLAGAVEMLERVHRVHLDYLSGQSALHRQFLEQQARGQARLLAAMGVAEEQAPAALPVPPPVAPTGERGAAFTMDRAALAVHAGGQISTVFGPRFAEQDAYPRQCRMPEPPLLLADRVTDLVAEPASMGRGVVWTETDVRADSWYLHQGRMPTGILIESGQADLLLISYLGCDLLNRGERVYRLLGCDMTILGDLPSPGETLRYEIHVDGHARQGDVRLFFFHYDCTVNGVPRIRVRGGQAGFFTTEELAASAGILWDPATAVAAPDARLDPPAITGAPARYGPEALRAFAEGRPWECFGPAWAPCKAHVRTPNIQGGQMLFLEAVTAFEPTGGPWRRGYLRAETEIHPDDWYFAGHFKGDPCMPGTLMFEGSVQALSFTLAALGFTVERDGWRFQPVTGETVPMRCRGQVTPSSKRLVYEVFIEELISGPLPTVRADLLCTVDGLKAFHAKRFGLSLVPDWPLGAQPELLLTAPDPRAATLPNGHRFDQDALIASAIGRPSAAFGHGYARFDGPERAPRLPGPPYHFISRVTEIHGEFGSMQAGIRAVTEYDIPQGAWYLDDSGAMPFAVLLEAALQPCGWLATFVGCTLGAEQELFFRNLDGQLTLVGEPSRTLRPGQGPLTAELGLERLSRSAGMILVAFTVSLRVGPHPVGSMSTVFGFFPAAALANQAGLPCPPAERARLSAASAPVGEGALRRDGRLRLLDRVTGWWPEAGELRAEKAVDPLSWYFKAHFFQDPVQPGSLGVEAMLEALEAAHRLHFGLCGAPAGGYSLVPGSLSWRYRGQVRPGDGDVVITATGLTFGGDAERGWVRGGASLWIDGKRIYEASELGLAYQAPGPLGPGHSSVTTLPRFG